MNIKIDELSNPRLSVWIYYIAFIILLFVFFAGSYFLGILTLNDYQIAAKGVIPDNQIQEHVIDISNKLYALGFCVFVVIAIVSAAFYYRIVSPLREIGSISERLAEGYFHEKLPEYAVKEINDLAIALNRMVDHLQHLEHVRSDFVANVSHELKTPITSIKGFVETLLDGAKDNKEDLNHFLEIVARQSERLTVIIEDLLALSRLETDAGDSLLSIHESDFSEIVKSVAEMVQPRADARKIKITVKIERDVKANIDRSLIEQAVTNLVDNAIKYSPPNTVVKLVVDKRRNSACIKVIDEGPGIPEEHLPRIFERFYRVDKARSRALGGTGLGLSIVKHIVAVHRGYIEVRSEPSKGSEFTLVIPIRP